MDEQALRSAWNELLDDEAEAPDFHLLPQELKKDEFPNEIFVTRDIGLTTRWGEEGIRFIELADGLYHVAIQYFANAVTDDMATSIMNQIRNANTFAYTIEAPSDFKSSKSGASLIASIADSIYTTAKPILTSTL